MGEGRKYLVWENAQSVPRGASEYQIQTLLTVDPELSEHWTGTLVFGSGGHTAADSTSDGKPKITLLGLIESAGLVDALSGEDALTVFAPTDAALKRFIDGLPSEPGKIKSGEASFTVMT